MRKMMIGKKGFRMEDEEAVEVSNGSGDTNQ